MLVSCVLELMRRKILVDSCVVFLVDDPALFNKQYIVLILGGRIGTRKDKGYCASADNTRLKSSIHNLIIVFVHALFGKKT